MPNLKDLRSRIKSVKSTQKITSAMKMLAAARLRKAQDLVVSARPYAAGMRHLLGNLIQNTTSFEEEPILLTGREDVKAHLLIVVTSDRGLCGGFNATIVRETLALIEDYKKVGIPFKIMCIGRKGRAMLRREYGDYILETIDDWGRGTPDMNLAMEVSTKIKKYLDDGVVGKVKVVYSVFRSALSQQVTHFKLIPAMDVAKPLQEQDPSVQDALYEYEPDQSQLLMELLPRNLSIQIYQVLLETSASEHGARMTAMDNATRNADDVIYKLELTYNRTRQTHITSELIEIISGAEAL